MKLTTPTPAEVGKMFEEYLAELRTSMPAFVVTGETYLAMKDAFFAGVVATVVRNAPVAGEVQ